MSSALELKATDKESRALARLMNNALDAWNKAEELGRVDPPHIEESNIAHYRKGAQPGAWVSETWREELYPARNPLKYR